MAVWAIVVIVVLFVVLIALGVLNSMTTSNNQVLARRQIILPFSATIDPTTGSDTGFMNINGEPQIKCESGTKVNIIGAFFDVFDPYNECAANAGDTNPFLAFMCNPTIGGALPPKKACAQPSDCPYYTGNSTDPFTCNPNTQLCQLTPQSVCNNSALKPTVINGKTYCVDPDLCGSTIVGNSGLPGVPNPVCSPSSGSVNQCAIRDASASVAAVCDGKQDCANLTMADFGDLPCLGSDPSLQPRKCIVDYKTNLLGSSTPEWLPYVKGGFLDFAGSRRGYCALPYLPGYAGGLPTDSTGSASPASSNVGYSMHGIYTCVPA